VPGAAVEEAGHSFFQRDDPDRAYCDGDDLTHRAPVVCHRPAISGLTVEKRPDILVLNKNNILLSEQKSQGRN